jgi:fructose-1,6-bisphosphatase I
MLDLAEGCAEISRLVRRGALAGALGSAETENVQGEEQKKLDVLANDLLLQTARSSPSVAAAASEEMEDPVILRSDGEHLILFDPLDGSSNIDVNMSIGTIISVLARRGRGPVQASEFLQVGRAQIAAAYALYGPQTTFTLTVDRRVTTFTLDPESGAWALTQPDLAISPSATEFAINMSNQRHWRPAVQTYIKECLQGQEGPRGKNFNMRWVGAMVAEVHRILSRGGVFLYPWDAREPDRAGKLRLMYEANPLGLITDGRQSILDMKPEGLHQRVGVVLGAKEEVERVASLH